MKLIKPTVKVLTLNSFIMGIWRQIQEYLFLKKRDPKAYTNTYLKYMNGMNRISLFMFLIAVIIMLVKFVIIPLFH
jgi:Ni,Fe-hydrogenase I cytochrome b subunit